MPDAGNERPAAAQDDGTVAAALQLLDGLEDRPVIEHVAVFDAVHRSLQASLATLDQV